MDLFVVHHIRQNQAYPHVNQDGWINAWAIEAEVTRRAGDSVALLFVAAYRGLKALFSYAAKALSSGPVSVPVRVAARHERVELAARNDDRAAA
ncbi:MAG TPA: hypothetical protein VGO34_11340 [Alphaproteobacteria bacterium]|jgi:hypothetical protein